MENNIPYYVLVTKYFSITSSTMTSWIILALLAMIAWSVTRKLLIFPSKLQTVLEGIYLAFENTIKAVLPDKYALVLPFIATLWIFILIANLIGILPEISSPTADISVTAALAILVFFSVHWYGIQAEGLRQYLGHYLKPNPLLLPFHIVSEISRTIAMAVRLFGNMMSLQLVVIILLYIAGFLIPIPFLMLHVVEAIIQSYIFGMLALVYIAGSIQSYDLQKIEINKEHLDE